MWDCLVGATRNRPDPASYNHCHRHYLIELANSVRLVEHHENFGPEGWGGVYTGLVRDVHGKNFYRCTDSTR